MEKWLKLIGLSIYLCACGSEPDKTFPDLTVKQYEEHLLTAWNNDTLISFYEAQHDAIKNALYALVLQEKGDLKLSDSLYNRSINLLQQPKEKARIYHQYLTLAHIVGDHDRLLEGAQLIRQYPADPDTIYSEFLYHQNMYSYYHYTEDCKHADAHLDSMFFNTPSTDDHVHHIIKQNRHLLLLNCFKDTARAMDHAESTGLFHGNDMFDQRFVLDSATRVYRLRARPLTAQ